MNKYRVKQINNNYHPQVRIYLFFWRDLYTFTGEDEVKISEYSNKYPKNTLNEARATIHNYRGQITSKTIIHKYNEA